MNELDRQEALVEIIEEAGADPYDLYLVAANLIELARNEPEKLAEALGLDLRVVTPASTSEPAESLSDDLVVYTLESVDVIESYYETFDLVGVYSTANAAENAGAGFRQGNRIRKWVRTTNNEEQQ